MIRFLLDTLCWRRSRGRSSRWSASFPCRSRWESRKHIPHDSSRDAPDIFGRSRHSFSSLTGMQRCCHGSSLQLESGPLWMEGCWSAGTDVACAWTSVAAVQQGNNNKKAKAIQLFRVTQCKIFDNLTIFNVGLLCQERLIEQYLVLGKLDNVWFVAG